MAELAIVLWLVLGLGVGGLLGCTRNVAAFWAGALGFVFAIHGIFGYGAAMMFVFGAIVGFPHGLLALWLLRMTNRMEARRRGVVVGSR